MKLLQSVGNITFSLLAGLLVCTPVVAQLSGSDYEAAVIPSRVVQRIDETRLVTLPGNVHPMAKSAFDQGLIDAQTRMDRMILVLQRSPEQEKELAAFNERQYDSHSPDFHHWLHAEEFGKRFGPSDSDMNMVVSWLQGHGFAIAEVSKGRTTIQFSGSAAQVQEAFHLELHNYLVRGEQHIANQNDPAIPEALAPVVAGLASLNNFFAKPQTAYGHYVKRDLKTGQLTKLGPAHPELRGQSMEGGLKALQSKGEGAPQLTYTPSGGSYPHEDMTPYDFATVYNILPSWNAKVLGSGIPIAISGVSDISAADVTSFRKSFGLSAFSGTFKTIVNGTDPGADGGGGQGENTLDVEMAGATAPNAEVILVVSKSTSTTGGDMLSDEYIIDNEVAHIMTGSYGNCELSLGKTRNAAYNSLWQQGATEGISIFESSGDQGSAGCSSQDTPAPNADSTGLQVNGLASSPYLTAVGGTDFTWSFVSGGPAKYWNTSNGSDLQNAKGYMPEVPWNSTCTNPLVYPLFSNGYTSPEQLCNGVINTNYDGLIVITAGSGGESHCTTGGTTNANCTGGWPKPSWQTGLGVPADGHRDLPDVSLFASAWFPDGIVGSAILDCEASSGSPEKTCDYTNPSYIIYQETGGTSASSPLMAGIMALVQQKTGAAQGLANPTLYSLYAKQVAAGTACDSSTVTNSSSCVFNDISSGTNAQVCIAGDSDCVVQTSGDQLGILSGYPATKGYDRAIGLGSVNVYNLVNAWAASVKTAPAVTLNPTSLTFASTAVGSTTSAQTITVKNTGTATLTLTSETITGTNASSFVKSATTCGSSLAVNASCTVSVEFKPATTGALSASLSIADNASGSPQTAALKGTGAAAAANSISLSPTSMAFPNTVVGATSAAQVVTVTNTGSATVSLTSIASSGSSFFELNNCGTTLASKATCSIYVGFKPTATGAQTGTILVTDNATGSPQKVTLTGTGTTAPSVKLSTTSITFPTTKHGTTSVDQAVTLTNSGTATLDLTSIQLTGTNPTDFKTLNTCGQTLAAGANCTVYVAFSPAAAASYKATLSVTDSGSGSPQTVALAGTGN